MGIFIVYELQSEKSLKPGGYILAPGTVPPESAYEDRWNAVVIGCYEADDGRDACVSAARDTRRLGNYIAVEGFPMSIDFTAKPKKNLLQKKNGDGDKITSVEEADAVMDAMSEEDDD